MKKIALIITMLLTPALLATEGHAAEEITVLRLDYTNIQAYIPYTTGEQILLDAPRTINHLKVYTVGRYCQFVSRALSYKVAGERSLRAATPVGTNSTYNLRGRNVIAIKYDFEQTRFTGVDCAIEFRAVVNRNDPDPDPRWDREAAERAARYLSIDANLFTTRARLTDGYESVVADADAFGDLAGDLTDLLEAGATQNQAKRLFDLLDDEFNAVSRAYYRAHGDVLDIDMEEAYDELRDSFRKLRNLLQ